MYVHIVLEYLRKHKEPVKPSSLAAILFLSLIARCLPVAARAMVDYRTHFLGPGLFCPPTLG